MKYDPETIDDLERLIRTIKKLNLKGTEQGLTIVLDLFFEIKRTMKIEKRLEFEAAGFNNLRMEIDNNVEKIPRK